MTQKEIKPLPKKVDAVAVDTMPAVFFKGTADNWERESGKVALNRVEKKHGVKAGTANKVYELMISGGKADEVHEQVFKGDEEVTLDTIEDVFDDTKLAVDDSYDISKELFNRVTKREEEIAKLKSVEEDSLKGLDKELAKTKIDSAVGVSLPKGFSVDLETGQTVIPADASQEDLVKAFRSGMVVNHASGMANRNNKLLMGDLANMYQGKFNMTLEKSLRKADLELVGMSIQTIGQSKRIAKFLGDKDRAKYSKVGWGALQAIVIKAKPDGVDPAEWEAQQRAMLKKVLKGDENGPLSTTKTRKLVAEVVEKLVYGDDGAPVPFKPNYLIIVNGEASLSKIENATGVKKLVEDGHTVIKLGTTPQLVADVDGNLDDLPVLTVEIEEEEEETEDYVDEELEDEEAEGLEDEEDDDDDLPM